MNPTSQNQMGWHISRCRNPGCKIPGCLKTRIEIFTANHAAKCTNSGCIVPMCAKTKQNLQMVLHACLCKLEYCPIPQCGFVKINMEAAQLEAHARVCQDGECKVTGCLSEKERLWKEERERVPGLVLLSEMAVYFGHKM